LHSAAGEILLYQDSKLISRAELLRGRAGPVIGGQATHPRRGAADRGEYRQAARAITRKKKAAGAALVFEDWNGPTSSQRTVPVQRLKHIEAKETSKPKYGPPKPLSKQRKL
jgi:hypothetical protein